MTREKKCLRTAVAVLAAVALMAAAGSVACPTVLAAEKTIKLPAPQTGQNAFLNLLAKRASSRTFSAQALPAQVLSNLVWAAAGISRPESGKRTAPTANNRQEIDVYVATAQGLYLYDAKAQSLLLIREGDFRAATGEQAYVKDAAVNLVYVADLAKSGGRNDEDKLIYAAAAVGFISENVYLYCASEGLATVVRAYVNKAALGGLLNLKPSQRIILTQSVGYPKP